MTKSVSPPSSRFMVVVIVPFSLIHLAFLLLSLSITFARSQSVMQLFLSAWFVIEDLFSTVADSLLFPGKWFGCDVLNLLLAFLESCSKCSPCFTNVRVATALTRDLVYIVCPLYK